MAPQKYVDISVYRCVSLSVHGCVCVHVSPCVDLHVQACLYMWVYGHMSLCTSLCVHGPTYAVYWDPHVPACGCI